MDRQDFFSQRRHPVDTKSEIAKPQMDLGLGELLASANADHVFERGTGNFDLLIKSLIHRLHESKNKPFRTEILAAIRNLHAAKAIDPARANYRKEMRKALGDLGEDILEPRGPMELE